MLNEMLKIIQLIVKNGVVHRDEVKNDLKVVKRLLYHGLVRKVYRNRKVFYELTFKALPIVESMRKAMFENIKILAKLHKPPSAFHSLLEDVRFLDDRCEIAEQFKFLGDWQIQRPAVKAQLELARLRYYQKLKGK